MTSQPPKSLMRSLGEFFGHIIQGAKKPVGTDTREVRREVQQQSLPGGVTLRRTTIEEVQLPPPQQPS